MKKTLTIISAILLFNSCKKEKSKQYSYWKIDGIEYKSNNVEIAIGHQIASMGSRDSDRFDLRYYRPSFPTSGEWLIVKQNLSQNPEWVSMNFYLGNKIYHISPNEIKYLNVTSNNNKVQFNLSSTWFVEYNNPIDSVLIEGTFNEP
ncbi:MAG TPA: hypothetical protein VLZ83_08255 [Edaphocola sp.]|nr:hypothetical protein [Edaphocola sp.]